MDNSIGGIAVKIFFVVSGYLIYASWNADSNPSRYLARRLLRILPGLVVVVIISAFIIGPALSQFTLKTYFSDPTAYQYLYNIGLYPVYRLPGLFLNNAYPGAVNGSLWSLPVEFAMYMLLPRILLLGRFARVRYLLPAATLLLCAWSLWFVRINALPHRLIYIGTDWTSGLDVAPYFLLGATVRFMRWERFLDPVLALFMLGFVAMFNPYPPVVAEVILYLLLPYAVLSLATCAQRWLKSVGRYGDVSYGVYIYGFVVQQCVAQLAGNELSAVKSALLSLPIVVALALLSWHWVVKPMLSLKPGRRLLQTPVSMVNSSFVA